MSSAIHESRTVRCPLERLPEAAAAYVHTLLDKEGRAVVPLRMTVGDVIVERAADLLLKHSDASPGYEIMTISWAPHDGGPYPVFRGKLAAEDEGSGYCRLDLDGTYDPPFGIAGAAFDAVIGHHIALATARVLLEEMQRGFEAALATKPVSPSS